MTAIKGDIAHGLSTLRTPRHRATEAERLDGAALDHAVVSAELET